MAQKSAISEKAHGPAPGKEELTSAERGVRALVRRLGAPSDELREPWVRQLAVLNGLLHAGVAAVLARDRRRHLTKRGERKVAVFSVMNDKYIGLQYAALAAHIASGLVSHLGSSLAIALEDHGCSRSIAIVASAAELLLHAPSALAMSPWVYGDKGVTPVVYGLVSCLLGLSGATALSESLREPATGPRAELRRMNATISIFLYVRLYGLVRGLGEILSPQKYALSVMVAGTTMLPVAWARILFPLTFYAGGLYNWRTVLWTARSVMLRGIDATASRQARRLRA